MNTALASTDLEEAQKAVAELWQAQCIMHGVYQYKHAELQNLSINRANLSCMLAKSLGANQSPTLQQQQQPRKERAWQDSQIHCLQ